MNGPLKPSAANSRGQIISSVLARNSGFHVSVPCACPITAGPTNIHAFRKRIGFPWNSERQGPTISRLPPATISGASGRPLATGDTLGELSTRPGRSRWPAGSSGAVPSRIDGAARPCTWATFTVSARRARKRPRQSAMPNSGTGSAWEHQSPKPDPFCPPVVSGPEVRDQHPFE